MLQYFALCVTAHTIRKNEGENIGGVEGTFDYGTQFVPPKSSQSTNNKDRDSDQEIGYRELVVSSNVGLRIGRRGLICLILTRIIITIEEDRVFKDITL